jgi:5-formyltetrahydrofolate cyclo-ligase
VSGRLPDIEPWESARAIKVNPDSPQRPLRAEALRRGITVFVPTPRLRGGFKKLDPRRIPPDKIEEAASLSRGDRWSEEVALGTLRSSKPSSAAPSRSHAMGGAVARVKATATWNSPSCASSVTRRCLSPRPCTLQVVDSVPRDPTDQPLSVIATPSHVIRIKRPSAARTGIDWTRLTAEDLEEMPILAELKRMTTSNAWNPTTASAKLIPVSSSGESATNPDADNGAHDAR